MIEILFAVIALLIVMTLVLCKYYNSRFSALEGKLQDVAEYQKSVKELAEAVHDLKDAVKSEKTVPQASEKAEEEKKELANPVVSVGQRQPAVVAARPMTVVKAEKAAAAAEEEGVPDEVVAVIMAAVAAAGYSPAAIRSIRPQRRGYKRHRENWAMAARLGGMNR
ncbi:MAG: hypothetical protein ACI4NR_08150 [Megasphaera sp.]|uniref:hypothetical protein n=1 Tax=Megasphaera sp. TaxID=2023260 RepID=UPI003F00FB7B